MQRKFVFKAGTTQLTLPVTPESFTVSEGRRIETVNIHELGDANLAGGKTLDSINISCLLPARDYPFGEGGEPYDIVGRFVRWKEKKSVVRFIIPDTGVNRAVLIENISYGERDGTNDVYAELSLREYRELETVATRSQGAQNNTRAQPDDEDAEQAYIAVYGDTLCGICRKYYGDGSYALAERLAGYNGRPNPNVLFVGERLRIPPRRALGG